MTHDATNWLHEILRLGRRILQMTEGFSFAGYQSSEWPRIGVERYLISLGEAARAAMNDDPGLRDHLPGLIKANDLRNFLTHAYLHIDDLIVWNTVEEELPRLLQDVERRFREPEP